MTQQQKVTLTDGVPAVASPLTGNTSARAVAEKSSAVLNMVTETVERIKLSDLPSKKLRLLALAEAIEREELAAQGVGFNMGSWKTREFSDEYNQHLNKMGHTCGTIACIAGWTAILEDGINTPKGVKHRAASILGLTLGEAHMLFYASGSHTQIEDISAKRAVAVIRHLAETGDVSWDRYNQEGKKVV